MSAPSLDQTKLSLWRVNIDLFLQVNSLESCADVHLMDLEIVPGGNRECQTGVAHGADVAW